MFDDLTVYERINLETTFISAWNQTMQRTKELQGMFKKAKSKGERIAVFNAMKQMIAVRDDLRVTMLELRWARN